MKNRDKLIHTAALAVGVVYAGWGVDALARYVTGLAKGRGNTSGKEAFK